MTDRRRIRVLRQGEGGPGQVVLWMSRDQRANDNWALLFAQELAMIQKTPLSVLFCLAPQFLNATIRQYGFMVKGLQEVQKTLKKKNIPFFLLKGSPEIEVPKFVHGYEIGTIVTDFSPLRINIGWKESLIKNIR